MKLFPWNRSGIRSVQINNFWVSEQKYRIFHWSTENKFTQRIFLLETFSKAKEQKKSEIKYFRRNISCWLFLSTRKSTCLVLSFFLCNSQVYFSHFDIDLVYLQMDLAVLVVSDHRLFCWADFMHHVFLCAIEIVNLLQNESRKNVEKKSKMKIKTAERNFRFHFVS